tara:strand:- start:8250 stop:9332 length:1083 start_codon:yes stop_codon:yes gene_type:complete
MHILLKSSRNYKGIIIATHKEMNYGFNIDFMKKISIRYHILIHNGSVNNCKYYNFLSYNLISDSRCLNNKCLPFTSRNFLNSNFNTNFDIKEVNSNIIEILKYNEIDFNIKLDEKNFDFICVNVFGDHKKTYELLLYFLNYIKKYPEARACFIGQYFYNNDYYKKVIKLWESNKNNNICFIDTRIVDKKNNNKIYHGLTSEQLSNFYKSSKTYMHGCELEGESRTIHEALCCCCKILAKENMKGGGLDHLNKTNSELYNNKSCLIKMHKILSSYNMYKPDLEFLKNFDENYSSDKLIKILFNNLNYSSILTFDTFKKKCDVENLMFALPAHLKTVPWYIKGKSSADIFEMKQLKILNNFI